MSYGWNAWAFRVDESLKEKNQQIDALAAESKKKDEHIEKLEVQSMDLQERLRARALCWKPYHLFALGSQICMNALSYCGTTDNGRVRLHIQSLFGWVGFHVVR